MLQGLERISQTSQNANDTNQDNSLAKFKGILQFLNTKNEEIPIYVAGSINYGHQRTAVAVLRRLMVLGGIKFRLVYEKSNKTGKTPNDHPATQKLTTLIPGLTEDAIGSQTGYDYTYTSCTAKLVFTKFEDANNLAGYAFLMGFTGGYDNPESTICEQLVSYFTVVLQPYAYIKHNAINTIFGRWIIRQKGAPEQTNLPTAFADKLGFYIETPTRPNTFVDRPQPMEGDDWKRQILTQVFAHLDAQSVDLCPVYFSQGRTKAFPPTILFNLITGLLNAKSRTNTGLTINQKPSVVLIMSPFVEEIYWVLTYLLDSTDEEWNETRNSATIERARKLSPLVKTTTRDYLKQVDYPSKFQQVHLVSRTVPYAVPDYQAAYNNAGPGGIIIIDLQNVPNSDFDYVFSRGTLPAVFEGEGSASLMLNLGKPFFHLTAHESAERSIYPDMPQLGNVDVIGRCQKIYRNFEDAAWDSPDNKPDVTIGQFLVDAYTPTHNLYKYFKSIGDFFHDPANDKVHQAIPVLLNLLKDARGKGKSKSTLNEFPLSW